MSETHRSTAPERSYRYACADSDVGPLLVVMSEDGLLDVILGESLDELLRAAAAWHPGVCFTPDRGIHAEWVASVVRRFEQPASGVVVRAAYASGFPAIAATTAPATATPDATRKLAAMARKNSG